MLSSVISPLKPGIEPIFEDIIAYQLVVIISAKFSLTVVLISMSLPYIIRSASAPHTSSDPLSNVGLSRQWDFALKYSGLTALIRLARSCKSPPSTFPMSSSKIPALYIGSSWAKGRL